MEALGRRSSIPIAEREKRVRSLRSVPRILPNDARDGTRTVQRIVANASSKSADAASDGAEAQAEVLRTDEEATFHFIVSNAHYMLNDENTEHFPELLRERRRHFLEKGRAIDFWVVPNPAFLDSLPDGNKVQQPSCALVSLDREWITFMKLRLDRVLKGEIQGKPNDVLQSTAPIEPFEPPPSSQWTAPYSKYSSGWWTAFEPPVAANSP